MTSIQRYDLSVTAADGQYWLDASQLYDDPWPDPVYALFTGEEDWIAILTGTQYGPVTVHVTVTGTVPEQLEPGWDMAGERDLLLPAGTVRILTPASTPALQLQLDPGRYRVRIHVRGRSEAQPYGHLEEPLEEHHLVLWPTRQPQSPALLTGPDEYADDYR